MAIVGKYPFMGPTNAAQNCFYPALSGSIFCYLHIFPYYLSFSVHHISSSLLKAHEYWKIEIMRAPVV